MTGKEQAQGIRLEDKVGEAMNYITFGELIKELTGSPFEEIYKDYRNQGVIDEQGNME
jgi:hypothetical protein